MHSTALELLLLVIQRKARSITTMGLIGRRRRRREAGPIIATDSELVQGWLEHRSCHQADRESSSDSAKLKLSE